MNQKPLKQGAAKTPADRAVHTDRADQATAPCPCGTGQPYAHCCGRWHAGEAAPTAEALMRSRYSAFVLGKADYLRATWHASTRPHTLKLDPDQRWLGLTVQRHVQALKGDPNRALVAFVARSKEGGRATRLQESSRFVREDGRWYYVDADPA